MARDHFRFRFCPSTDMLRNRREVSSLISFSSSCGGSSSVVVSSIEVKVVTWKSCYFHFHFFNQNSLACKIAGVWVVVVVVCRRAALVQVHRMLEVRMANEYFRSGKTTWPSRPKARFGPANVGQFSSTPKITRQSDFSSPIFRADSPASQWPPSLRRRTKAILLLSANNCSQTDHRPKHSVPIDFDHELLVIVVLETGFEWVEHCAAGRTDGRGVAVCGADHRWMDRGQGEQEGSGEEKQTEQSTRDAGDAQRQGEHWLQRWQSYGQRAVHSAILSQSEHFPYECIKINSLFI